MLPGVGRSAEVRRADLVELYRVLHADHGCPLAASRTNLVFGMGNADAELMFVGEAPGKNEDLQGKPFVGQAGQLLDKLLGEIGMERSQVFVANVLMCRPPGNRDPLPQEIEECKPYLMRKIELIEPKMICTLGNFATKTITGSPMGITRVCGRPQKRELGGLDVTVYPLFHPAAALRSTSCLENLREHMARIPELLAQLKPPERVADPDVAGAGSGEPVAAGAAPAPQLDLFG
jgi:uracil-DNA glycosylase family 4